MGTYTGTDSGEYIGPDFLAYTVVASPSGTRPGDGPDSLIGNGGDDTLDSGYGDDVLNGGDGNDYLSGNIGADTMRGGSGNDLYFVEDLDDLVIEDRADSAGGVDSVSTEISCTLGFGVEKLILYGLDLITGTGNALNNTVTNWSFSGAVLKGLAGSDHLLGGWGSDRLEGGEGDDRLNGREGQDQLRGGPGNDEFVFRHPKECGDTVTDFGNTSGEDDQIVINAIRFGDGLEAGSLSGEEFQRSAGHEARDAEVRFIFDIRNETLWFDANGDAKGGLTLVANLQDGATLHTSDIWLI